MNKGFGEEMDALCTTLATTAGLGGVWQAFLPYHTSVAAIDRLQANGPWHRVGSGELVFADKVELGQVPRVSLAFDETGAQIEESPLPVWTSLTPEGAYSYYDCHGWSTDYDVYEGSQGDGSVTTGEWRSFRKVACNQEAHLYCFEQ